MSVSTYLHIYTSTYLYLSICLMLGLGKKERVVVKRERKTEERYPGTGCGLSGKEEEGHYLPLTQAWLGPIPLIPDTKEIVEKLERKKKLKVRVW